MTMSAKKIKDTLQKQIQTDTFSGVCSLREKDSVILEACHGYLEWPNKIPINMNTRFGIASGTKLFTALGIMRLVELGKINLDDNPFDYMAFDFPTYSNDVTIRHLLTHTSGIPDYFDEAKIDDTNQFFVDVPWNELNKPSDYVSIMPKTPMVFDPGTHFAYNNSGFVLLAIIIESLTGDYHAWLQKEVLDRAGMTHSGSFRLDQLPRNTAYGYIRLPNGTYKTNQYLLPVIAGGDGGMYTTANDMTDFWQAFMNGKIVKKDLVKEMLTVQYQSKDIIYGLGLWLEKCNEHYLPYIVGEDPGVSFKSHHNPYTNRTYTILSNTQDGVWPLARTLKEIE